MPRRMENKNFEIGSRRADLVFLGDFVDQSFLRAGGIKRQCDEGKKAKTVCENPITRFAGAPPEGEPFK